MDFELMRKLSEADGVSSDEGDVAKIMAEHFKNAGLKTEIDECGNLIAYKSLGKKPLVVAAHMDEIGLMAKHIDEKGFIRFIKIGGIDNRTLVNQQVTVRTKDGMLPGVIGFRPIHVIKDEEMKVPIDAKSLFIDIGAKDRADAERMGVEIGSTATFNTQFRRLGESMFSGKALDDRIGCYLLLQAAEGLPENVVLMGTSQEEVSVFGKGAQTASFTLDPRAFIAVDITVAGDHPEMKPEEAPIVMGKGPALGIVEAGARGNVANRKLVQKVLDAAKKESIPVQMEVVEGGATDAASVNNIRGGVPSLAINVPTRYVHSTITVGKDSDVDAVAKLVRRLVREL